MTGESHPPADADHDPGEDPVTDESVADRAAAAGGREPPGARDVDPVLSVRDLATHFHTEEGVVKAVDGISYDLYPGETLGIVGESGSGKSVSAMSVLNLVDSPGRVERGEVRFQGRDLLELDERALRDLRGNQISLVLQDPMSSLNPVDTVGYQIARVVRRHQGLSKRAARERAVELIDEMGIPEPESRVDEYPHQLSGGMRQRVLLAMAMSCEPDVLVLDEPTTALDVTIEAQIFELVDELQAAHDVAVILITHDLGVVAGACDRVAVFYAGRIVERAPVDELFARPKHPYTRGLMRSIPRLSADVDRLSPIAGTVPNLAALPSGCSFHPRCPHATDHCERYDPELRDVGGDSEAACLHAKGYGPLREDAPRHRQRDGNGGQAEHAAPGPDGGRDETETRPGGDGS
jgi:peptide/nickel transport system ATP-binding protein